MFYNLEISLDQWMMCYKWESQYEKTEKSGEILLKVMEQVSLKEAHSKFN